MNLVSMLMPLETLPGWPAVPPVSVVRTLLLLVGFPLLMILITAGIGAIRPAKSSYDLMQEREALWVGSGAPEAITEKPGTDRGVLAADEAASSQRAEDRGPGDKGGASARW